MSINHCLTDYNSLICYCCYCRY